MANWKKVVVSGSAPELANLQVDGLTADQVVIGGGSAGNLSTTAINGTGNIVATTAASGLEHSGSFSGSFEGTFSGDGTNLTGVTAEWDGTMFVGNVSGLASAQITGSGAAPSLILSGSTGNDLVVENDAEIKGNTKLSGSLSLENRAAEQILYTGANGLITGSNKFRFEESGNGRGIHFTTASNDGSGNPSNNSSIYGVQLIKMAKDGGGGILSSNASQPGVPGTSGIAFGPAGGASDGHSGSVSLYSNTGGAGFDARNDGNLTLRTSGATRFTVTDSNSTFSNNLVVTGNTTLGNAQTDTTQVTGSLLITGSNVFNGVTNFIGKSGDGFDFDIKIGGPESVKGMHFDNLESGKNIGITFDSVASPGNFVGGLFHRDSGGSDSMKLLMHDRRGNQDMVVITGRNETNIIGNKLTVGTTSADNDNTLSVAGNIKALTGITSSNLTNDNLLVAGAAGEIESSGITFNGSALDLGSSNITTTGNGTFGGDVTISGDLAVAGTASFTHASNLDVADKYILLNSGSSGNSDSGGVVIQGPGQDIGDLFGYRSGSAKTNTQQRWGIASGFDAKTSADFTPSAFMAAVVVGTNNDPAVAGADYAQAGNMYIDTDAGYDGIWIYS